MKEAFALYLAEQVPQLSSVRGSDDITFAEYKTQNPMEFANCRRIFTIGIHILNSL